MQSLGKNPRFWLWRVHWKFLVRILISIIKPESRHLPNALDALQLPMPTSTCTLGRAQITKLLGQGTNKQQQKHFWAEMDPCLEDCGLPWQTQASSRQDVFQKHATRQSKHKSLIHLSLHNFTLMLSLNVPEGKGKVLVGEKRAHFPKLNQSKPMRKAHWQKHPLYRHNLSHSSLISL